MNEKSILEQALLQVQTLEEAVKQNAKGILASTMKQELNDLLKESMEEEDTDVTSMEEQPTPDEEETDDMSDEETNNEDGDDDTENVDDLDNEDPSTGIDSMDSETDDEAGEESTDDFSFGDDSVEDEDDEDVMDMTGASDEEVLKVFKAMKPEDGIVVKKDGNHIELETGDDDYIIKLDGEDETPEIDENSFGEDDINPEEEEEANPFDEEGVNPEEEEDSNLFEEDENIYEIELDDEEDTEETTTEGALKGLSNPKKVEPKESALKGLSNPKKVEPKESALKGLSNPKKVEPKESALKGLSNPKKVEPKEEEEVGEAARTKSNPHGDKNGMNRAGLKSKKMYKAGSTINEEVETLRKQNAEYKKALVLFKDKLNEVAVFNANLAYATRLFTEQSTTKQEKLNILKRFDSVSTMNESKNLFNTIKTELGQKKPMTEAVVEKISTTPTTSSTEVLSEAKAYENPQFKRMKDLMSKIK